MSTHDGEEAECVRRLKNQCFTGSWGSGGPPNRCLKTPSKDEEGIRLRTRRSDLRIKHNHANPPWFERQRAAYKCIVEVLQYGRATRFSTSSSAVDRTRRALAAGLLDPGNVGTQEK
jgi:hypothetical protein